VLVDLKDAQDGYINVSPADHSEGGGAVEIVQWYEVKGD
jgi:hypothetical protein